MIYTKQAIKLFEDFSIFMVFEFLNTLKNRTSKLRSIKTSIDQKLVKETCYKQKTMHDTMHDIMHEPMNLNIGSINART